MARLSNKEIEAMPIPTARIYTKLHPAESWRFAKIHGKYAIEETENAVMHGFKTNVLFAASDTMKCVP